MEPTSRHLKAGTALRAVRWLHRRSWTSRSESGGAGRFGGWHRPGSSNNRTSRRAVPAFLLLLLLPLSAQTDPTTRVGIPVTLTDLYIPGGEVRPKPRPNHEPPLVLRLLEVKPAADGHRYDLEVYGLDEGRYNLADFLEPVDPASPPRFVKELPLVVSTELPPGLPKPAELTANPPPKVGGYRAALWALGILWILVFALLLFWKKRRTGTAEADAAPPTLAERLRELVTMASQGALDANQQATLERLVLGHWHQRLPELDGLPPARALAKLRHHEEAGPLLRQLEAWLHARNPEIDAGQIEELLTPYRG